VRGTMGERAEVELLKRAAFAAKHPIGDEVPGALRAAFFELFSQGWDAAVQASPVQPEAEHEFIPTKLKPDWCAVCDYHRLNPRHPADGGSGSAHTE
jgi:hypothetical protein